MTPSKGPDDDESHAQTITPETVRGSRIWR